MRWTVHCSKHKESVRDKQSERARCMVKKAFFKNITQSDGL